MNRNSNIEFIYFDIGGVLVDHIASYKKIAKDLEIDQDKLLALSNIHVNELDRGTLPWKDFENILYKKFDTSHKLPLPLAETFVKNFVKIRETQEFIQAIVKDPTYKMKIGIFSNIALEVFDAIEKFKLIPEINYDVIIKSGVHQIIKPEKEIYELGTEMAKTEPKNILLVDDKTINIKGAKNYGWQTYLFETKNPDKSVVDLRKLILK